MGDARKKDEKDITDKLDDASSEAPLEEDDAADDEYTLPTVSSENDKDKPTASSHGQLLTRMSKIKISDLMLSSSSELDIDDTAPDDKEDEMAARKSKSEMLEAAKALHADKSVDTSKITHEMMQPLVYLFQEKHMEETGKPLYAFVRFCPIAFEDADDIEPGQLLIQYDNGYDTEAFETFLDDLKKIQDELNRGSSTENVNAHLLLNFGDTHWTYMYFEVNKKGMQCLCLDAYQSDDLEELLPLLNKVIDPTTNPNDKIYVAQSPRDEKPQTKLTCAFFAIHFMNQCAHEPNIFTILAKDRASQGHSYSESLEKAAKGILIVRWTSFPAEFVRANEDLDTIQLYMERNPKAATICMREVNASLAEVADITSAKTTLIEHKGRHHNNALRGKFHTNIVNLMQQALAAFNSIDELHPDNNRPPLAAERRQLEQTAQSKQMPSSAGAAATLTASADEQRYGHIAIEHPAEDILIDIQATSKHLASENSDAELAAIQAKLLLAIIDRCRTSTLESVADWANDKVDDDDCIIDAYEDLQADLEKYAVTFSNPDEADAKIAAKADEVLQKLNHPDEHVAGQNMKSFVLQFIASYRPLKIQALSGTLTDSMVFDFNISLYDADPSLRSTYSPTIGDLLSNLQEAKTRGTEGLDFIDFDKINTPLTDEEKKGLSEAEAQEKYDNTRLEKLIANIKEDDGSTNDLKESLKSIITEAEKEAEDPKSKIIAKLNDKAIDLQLQNIRYSI